MMIKEPYKILIVDDEEGITDIVGIYLKQIYEDRLEIHETNDPKKALEIIQKGDIDFLITDLTMPKITGEILLVEAMKAQKGIQVIVLSGMDTYVTALNCFLDGAASFIKKPPQKEQIKDAVDICIHKLEFWKEFLNETIRAKLKKD